MGITEDVQCRRIDELDAAVRIHPIDAFADRVQDALQAPALVVDGLAVEHCARQRAHAREEQFARFRLEHALDRAGTERLGDHPVGVGSGDDRGEDAAGFRHVAQLLDQHRAIVAGHEVIDDGDVEVLLHRLDQTIFGTDRGFNLEAFGRQQAPERDAHRRRIVDEQHAQLFAARTRLGRRLPLHRMDQLVQCFRRIGIVRPQQQRRARPLHQPVDGASIGGIGHHQHRQRDPVARAQQREHFVGAMIRILGPADHQRRKVPALDGGQRRQALGIVANDRHIEGLVRQHRRQRTPTRCRCFDQQDSVHPLPGP